MGEWVSDGGEKRKEGEGKRERERGGGESLTSSKVNLSVLRWR